MKVFISYSTGDLDLVRRVADEVERSAEVLYWDKDKKPGERAWKTIFGWIDTCDVMLVIITDRAVSRGLAVGKEIGRAATMGKTVIPLVDKNVPESELGCLDGRTYVHLDRDNPGAAMLELGEILGECAAALAAAETPGKRQERATPATVVKSAPPPPASGLVGVVVLVGAVLLVLLTAKSE